MTEISDEVFGAALEAFLSQARTEDGLRAALAAAEAVRSRTHVVVEPQSPAEAIHEWWANQRGSAEIPQALIDLYRKTHAVVPRDQAHRERQKEIMRLMREDFDPTPPNWEGREWHDNAEDVADKIEALLRAESAKASLREAVEVIRALVTWWDDEDVLTDDVWHDIEAQAKTARAFLAKLEKTNADPA